ncbi:MAG: rhomboid family intramembrane serine protease [Myxococcota bacterium]
MTAEEADEAEPPPPVAAWLLSAVLVAVHLASARAADPSLPLWRAVLLPRGLAHRIGAGGQYAPLVPEAPWRLCTTVLLHVDALHLALNVAALLALGSLAEARLGSRRWLAVFAVGGVAGAVVSHLVGVRLSDGASGGAFALVGAALVIGRKQRHALSPEERTVLGPVLAAFLALNLLLGLALPQINSAAHLGGLGAGLVLGALPELPAAEALVLAAFAAVCAWGWLVG